MILDEVHRGIQKNRNRKRIGRGVGSGLGKTAGRGHKGHGSRAGHAKKRVHEGGQTPEGMRIPKRGFNNRWAAKVVVVNLDQIDKVFQAGEEVTLAALAAKNLAKGRFDELKVLGNGELTKKLKVSAHRFSKSATEKIAKAGGEAVTLPGKTPVETKKRAARERAKAAKAQSGP